MRRQRKRRAYDSRRRRAAANDTRTAILDAASRLLLRDGYAATTITSIANAAGVSVETIYKTLRGKPGIVRALWQRGLGGAGPLHAEDRSDDLQRAATDPRLLIRAWSELAAEVSPRVSPILLLIRDAAAHDPAMTALLAETDATRLRRMAANAKTLGRFGIPIARARDVLWLATAPELYELLVIRRRWRIAEYCEYLTQMMTGALL